LVGHLKASIPLMEYLLENALYSEEYPTRNEALQRESQIKKLTREAKLTLIKKA